MTALKFLADEDLREDIVQAVLALDPSIDLVTVSQAGLRRSPDPQILQFAWDDSRIVISHDANTMIATAIARIAAQAGMAGLFIVPQSAERRAVAEDVALIASASDADEWRDRIEFLPW